MLTITQMHVLLSCILITVSVLLCVIALWLLFVLVQQLGIVTQAAKDWWLNESKNDNIRIVSL